jgi:hypothetical protein
MPLAGDAARRAAELDERHQRNETTFPDDNQSSGCTGCSRLSSRPITNRCSPFGVWAVKYD